MAACGGSKTPGDPRSQVRRNDDDDDGWWLPEELTFNILSRLRTAASVARLRCVRTSWRRLLSDPDFLRKFFFFHSSEEEAEERQVLISRPADDPDHYSKPPTSFSIHSYDDDTLRPISSGTLPVPGQRSIAGFSDGIFCITDYYNRQEIALWNPSTSETKLLPSLAHLFPRGGKQITGFGFDPVTDDYKVVVRDYNHRNSTEAFVYSLRDGSWRRLAVDNDGVANRNDAFMIGHSRVRDHPGMSRVERCHWSLPETDYPFALKFTTFDMSKEVFTELRLPRPTQEEREYFSFSHEDSFHTGRDGSSLIAVFYRNNDKDDDGDGMDGRAWFFKVWVALDYVALAKGECSWIRLYNICFVDESTPRRFSGRRLVVLEFWKNGKWFVGGGEKGAWEVIDTERHEMNNLDVDQMKGDDTSHLFRPWRIHKDSFWVFQQSRRVILSVATESSRGEWVPIPNLNDEHIVEIAEFAVQAHNMRLVKVEGGKIQYVAGWNYMLVMTAVVPKEGSRVNLYETIVYKKFSHVNKLISFRPLLESESVMKK